MGGGKTTAAIRYINESPDDKKFLFITPFLSEVERVKTNCKQKHFEEPQEHGSKLNSIKYLFSKGRNIVSTHALFKSFDEETINIINQNDYTLILDEVADVVQPHDISNFDLGTIMEKYAEVMDNGILKWVSNNYEGKFEPYKILCDLNQAGLYGGTILLWLFPIKTFQAFKNIFILTYMFDAQIQRYYYDFYGIKYNYIYISGNSHSNFRFSYTPVKKVSLDFKNLIHIYDNENLNAIGNSDTALSKNWYATNENTKLLKQLKNNIYNYFRGVRKTPVNLNLWTTFESYKNDISGKGYASGYLACNARASNAYRHKESVAYLVNRYFNPTIKNFFLQNGIRVEEDQYALSEMLQWIWRSAIRDGKEIWVYIPSSRMRNLLIDWINNIEKYSL